MKNKISTKNTIGIREYMNYYLDIPYMRDERLTHHKINLYLEEKGYPIPSSISFVNITREDILTGTYLLVREETKGNRSSKDSPKKGRILAYINPLRESLESLLNENVNNSKKLTKIQPKSAPLYHK